ncbi:MAG: hypothetical protein ACPF8V_01810 [Luteibaculum sp.]
MKVSVKSGPALNSHTFGPVKNIISNTAIILVLALLCSCAKEENLVSQTEVAPFPYPAIFSFEKTEQRAEPILLFKYGETGIEQHELLGTSWISNFEQTLSDSINPELSGSQLIFLNDSLAIRNRNNPLATDSLKVYRFGNEFYVEGGNNFLFKDKRLLQSAVALSHKVVTQDLTSVVNYWQATRYENFYVEVYSSLGFDDTAAVVPFEISYRINSPG